jgi:hypothetical protein
MQTSEMHFNSYSFVTFDRDVPDHYSEYHRNQILYNRSHLCICNRNILLLHYYYYYTENYTILAYAEILETSKYSSFHMHA